MVINNVHSTFYIGKVYGENTATNNRSWNDFFLHFIDLNKNNNICPCQQVFGKVFILALPCQISISLWGFGDAFSDRIFFYCTVAFRLLSWWVTIRPDQTILRLPIKFNFWVTFTEFTLLWTLVIFPYLICLASALHQIRGTICASNGTGFLVHRCTGGVKSLGLPDRPGRVWRGDVFSTVFKSSNRPAVELSNESINSSTSATQVLWQD